MTTVGDLKRIMAFLSIARWKRGIFESDVERTRVEFRGLLTEVFPDRTAEEIFSLRDEVSIDAGFEQRVSELDSRISANLEPKEYFSRLRPIERCDRAIRLYGKLERIKDLGQSKNVDVGSIAFMAALLVVMGVMTVFHLKYVADPSSGYDLIRCLRFALLSGLVALTAGVWFGRRMVQEKITEAAQELRSLLSNDTDAEHTLEDLRRFDPNLMRKVARYLS